MDSYLHRDCTSNALSVTWRSEKKIIISFSVFIQNPPTPDPEYSGGATSLSYAPPGSFAKTVYQTVSLRLAREEQDRINFLL